MNREYGPEGAGRRPLTDEQAGLALYAVTALITLVHRGTWPSLPPGMYRFREHLDRENFPTSVRGSENDALQAESTEEDLIDTAEAAEILNCSVRWVREIRRDLEAMNIGGRWVFRRQHVVEYAALRGQEHPAIDDLSGG